MTRILVVISIFLVTACNNSKTEKGVIQARSIINKNSIKERLENYFYDYEIEPSIIINNTDGNQTYIELGKHKIRWLDTENETKIKIDNDLFTLKDKATLNTVWDNKDSIDFINNWDEIKLFKHSQREYIGIRMQFKPCTGLACSVDYFLIYDLTNKAKNFFGHFKGDRKMSLFSFNGNLSYVSRTYKDSERGFRIDFIYQLFTLNESGKFSETKNSNGVTYQIKHTTFPDDTIKSEILEQNWIQQIK